MKGFILALTFTSVTALAQDEKPLAEKAGEAIQPFAESFSAGVHRRVNEFMSSDKGIVGDAARRNLDAMDQKEREVNRGPRKSMKECIKPNSLIDDDVRECTLGLREKTW